ncbi:MAG: dihydroneopterin aldolase [Chloroflexi bacterium]|nr:dihydroneopterin aldolase [Chloroflexota bacterium]
MHKDEITLKDVVFFGRHGVNPEETTLGQRFGVDISVWLDLSEAAASDHLEKTVSYAALYKIARAEVEGEPSKLIEHLAGRILSKVILHDPRITKARVTVTKLQPPLKGSATGSVAVTLERERDA